MDDKYFNNFMFTIVSIFDYIECQLKFNSTQTHSPVSVIGEKWQDRRGNKNSPGNKIKSKKDQNKSHVLKFFKKQRFIGQMQPIGVQKVITTVNE